MAHCILLIDDDPEFCHIYSGALKAAGHNVLAANSVSTGFQIFQQRIPAVVIIPMLIPHLRGFDMLQDFLNLSPKVQVIVVTERGSVENAIAVMRAGAFDYLQKPLDLDTLLSSVQRAFANFQAAQHQSNRTQHKMAEPVGIVAESTRMQLVLQHIHKISRSRASVLLQGESGTGKELLARELHLRSEQASGPFVVVNCPAIPAELFESELFGHCQGAFTGATKDKEGKFQQADGGTLFLDEIGELPLELQPKLLRALQEREVEPLGGQVQHVNVRIVAATNRDLEKEVDAGFFREDLYFRLAVMPINVPPLRLRSDDLKPLINYFLARKGESHRVSLSASLMHALESYDWPGNIRELENLLEQVLVLRRTDQLDIDDLPARIHNRLRRNTMHFQLPVEGVCLNNLEKDLILQALTLSRGNKTQAAKLLRISRHALHYRLVKHSLVDQSTI